MPTKLSPDTLRKMDAYWRAANYLAEPDIGLLLPCNVVVREQPEGHIVVGFMDPVAVMQMTSNAEVASVATEVRHRLERVRQALLRATD